MKPSLLLALVLMGSACQYQSRKKRPLPGIEVALQTGCSTPAKTIRTLTDQLGTIVYVGTGPASIITQLPGEPTYSYGACNLPTGLREGQRVRFSAQLKYQPSRVNGAVVDYSELAIELVKLTLLGVAGPIPQSKKNSRLKTDDTEIYEYTACVTNRGSHLRVVVIEQKPGTYDATYRQPGRQAKQDTHQTTDK